MHPSPDTARLPTPTFPDTALRLALEFEDGRRHSLPHCRPLTIGSAASADLCIVDPFVSCAHAQIQFSETKGYEVRDLDSTNGTLIDGVSVSHAQLEPGMRIQIGRVRLSVARLHPPREPEARAHRAVGDPGQPAPARRLIGRSGVMRSLDRKLLKLAGVTLPVVVLGETGTGKELAARTLHEFGAHAEAPFVALNCGAIPDALFESELFGHRRGAFTGAHRDHEGAFVRAGRGTVFLDEIGELPASAQAKLLRVLETRLVSPVGSERELEIRCRVVAATHRDLREMVCAGRFREDLYHRLSVVELELPPLRRRPRDIPALLEHFVDLAAAELEREVVLSHEAASAALTHAWPGNVRELRNAVFRSAALADGPISAAELIPNADRAPLACPGQAISVPRGTYASMNAALLQTVIAEEGSIRKAARVLQVPRSTLGAWVQKL